ncbi:MAG: hypothetical protein U1F83_01175 [Verrucomicrobiota bacterium]
MMLALTSGCLSPKVHSDPLAGWQFSSLNNLNSNKAITDDYHSYIQQLSPEERKSAGPMEYFEDGTGQHAVLIWIGVKNKVWKHILIYDPAGIRIRAIKYLSGHYHS